MNILPFHIINLKKKETHICSNLALELKKQRKSIRGFRTSSAFWQRLAEPDRRPRSPANSPGDRLSGTYLRRAGGSPPPARRRASSPLRALSRGCPWPGRARRCFGTDGAGLPPSAAPPAAARRPGASCPCPPRCRRRRGSAGRSPSQRLGSAPRPPALPGRRHRPAGASPRPLLRAGARPLRSAPLRAARPTRDPPGAAPRPAPSIPGGCGTGTATCTGGLRASPRPPGERRERTRCETKQGRALRHQHASERPPLSPPHPPAEHIKRVE